MDMAEVVSNTSNWPFQPPVSRVPRELLMDIFSLVASFRIARDYFLTEDDDDDDDDDEEPISFLTTIAVSQVCREWRRVALECRPLWAAIPLQSTELTKLALERSHNHPLLIGGNFNHEDPTQRPVLEAVECGLTKLERAFEISLKEISNEDWTS
ncbi:hypothetical protein OF83DRAFT_485477, partial [Amylostereum chailletii]